MKKLKLQVQVSVDGYMADASGNTDWMLWNWGADWSWDGELQDYFTGLKSSVDTVLLSRRMAEEGFIGHWAAISQNKNNPLHRMAAYINNAHKVVFSHKLSDAHWPNSSLARGNLVSAVTKLKQQPGKDIIAYGGASFAAALIEANLVDEYYLFINPVLLGAGLPLFDSPGRRRPLRLQKSLGFNSGMCVLQYTKGD